MFKCHFNPIGTVFKDLTLSSFSELAYFKGLIRIDNDCFKSATINGEVIVPEGVRTLGKGVFQYAHVNVIDLPSTLTYIKEQCFQEINCASLVIRASNPPVLYGYREFMYAHIKDVYVPDASIGLYKNAQDAGEYWKKMNYKPLSEYMPK
jgi:hypothetical protein